MRDDRNPTRRKVVFPVIAGRQTAFEEAKLSGEYIELPISDAAHRPLRGRIVAVLSGSSFVEIHAELTTH